jgi:serine protease SohB
VVQSHLIFKRIRALADEKKVPVRARRRRGGVRRLHDCLAADEIVCDASSIVGSIGGCAAFARQADREDRRRAAGPYVGRPRQDVDPFQPEKPEDVERLHKTSDIHESFINW